MFSFASKLRGASSPPARTAVHIGQIEDHRDDEQQEDSQDPNTWDPEAIFTLINSAFAQPQWGPPAGFQGHTPATFGAPPAFQPQVMVACAAPPPNGPRMATAAGGAARARIGPTSMDMPGAVAPAPRMACKAAPAAAPMMAFAAASAPAGAPAGGGIGFKTGGAQDAANFRQNVAAGVLPAVQDATFEGVVKDYFFETMGDSLPPPCTELFCPTYSLALAPDPLLAAAAAERSTADVALADVAPVAADVFLAVGLDSGLTDFKRPKLNLIILLDISGSMQGTFDSYFYDAASGARQKRGMSTEDEGRSKLDVAKEVMKGMLGKLGSDDSVAICLFNTAAASPKRMGRWGAADAVGLLAGIDGLRASGGTNFQAGLDEATRQLRGYADCIDGDPVTTENRVIVLTDAATNTGDTSEAGLVARLKANAADRFYTTIVGVGLDFNMQLVEAITKVRGANYFSVHTPGEFKQRLEEEFDFSVAPLVFDLELRVDPASLAPLPAQQAQQAQQEALEGPQAEQDDEWEEVHAEQGGEDATAGPLEPAGTSARDEGEAEAQAQAHRAAAGAAHQQEQEPGSSAAVVSAGGWTVVYVYGSPDSEERRLSGGGSIMRINTLFPSLKTEEGVKGGVVLLRMRPPPGTTAATAPPLRLAARYKDRSGQQYNTVRTVEVPAAAAEAATTGRPYFHSTGVRKAVLLARLVDALQCWLLDEWASSPPARDDSNAWQACEVAALDNTGGAPWPHTPPHLPPASTRQTPAAATASSTRLLRPGCPLLPPSAHAGGTVPDPQAPSLFGAPPARSLFGGWERTSRLLTVGEQARAALTQLLPYVEGEVAALGDAEMRQDVALLQKLVQAGSS